MRTQAQRAEWARSALSRCAYETISTAIIRIAVLTLRDCMPSRGRCDAPCECDYCDSVAEWPALCRHGFQIPRRCKLCPKERS